MSQQVVYIDGQFVPEAEAKISVFDHGVLYGDGVFEGIRLYDGNIFRCREHLDRLYDSAQAIAMKIPVSKADFEQILAETCRRNGLRDCYIRAVVTRGPGTVGLSPFKCPVPTIFVFTAQLRLYPDEYYRDGLTVITTAHRRYASDSFSPRIKSLNYLNNIMGKINAVNSGVQEGLVLSREGYVLEATADNVFVARHGILVTPPVYMGILKGITRDAVIELARADGIEVREEPITQYEVYTADECFLTGTAAEVVPVRVVDSRLIGEGRPGPITLRLIERFRAITTTDGLKI
jgi:branched-chain amino acid aminotransferase